MNRAQTAEWATIGAVLLDNSMITEIKEPLEPADFIDSSNMQIWGAITQMITDGVQAEVISVAEYLEKTTGKGWMTVVAGIVQNTASTRNCGHYAAIVKEEAQKRAAINIAQELESSVERDTDSINNAITKLMKLKTNKRSQDCTIGEAVTASVDEMEAMIGQDKIPGLSTGLLDLDDLLGGLQPGDLYIVGGRPGMGKTALMLNIANACGVPVGIASTEQPSNQVAKRMLCIEGYVSAYRMRVNQLTDDDWKKVAKSMGNLITKNIHINDRSRPHISEIMAQARKWKFDHNIQLLMVDYIQRVKGDPKAPKHERVEEITQSLKELARELEIPVVALAQINRKVDERTDKRPFVSDLKDSGAIEQEADGVFLLYRDAVYHADTQFPGKAEIIVGKNRHGPLATINSTWVGDFMQFRNYSSGESL